MNDLIYFLKSNTNINFFPESMLLTKIDKSQTKNLESCMAYWGYYKITFCRKHFYQKRKNKKTLKEIIAEDLTKKVYFPQTLSVFISLFDNSVLINKKEIDRLFAKALKECYGISFTKKEARAILNNLKPFYITRISGKSNNQANNSILYSLNNKIEEQELSIYKIALTKKNTKMIF